MTKQSLYKSLICSVGLGRSHNRGQEDLKINIKIFSTLGFAWTTGLLSLPLSYIVADWGRTLEKIFVFTYVIFNGLQVCKFHHHLKSKFSVLSVLVCNFCRNEIKEKVARKFLVKYITG